MFRSPWMMVVAVMVGTAFIASCTVHNGDTAPASSASTQESPFFTQARFEEGSDQSGVNTDDGAAILELQQSLRTIAETISPAVVNIRAEYQLENSNSRRNLPEFFQPFMDRNRRESTSIGSGAIISPDGYIITNYHVVQNATKIAVTLTDEREFEATLVGSDELIDLAVIKIDSSNLPFARVGDSDAVRVGDIVVAVGNPFGLRGTFTMGIVSATGRDEAAIDRDAAFKSYIQTDASINQGNSGGPLVDIHGHIIGINTAIFSQSGGSIGIGFAVPINPVVRSSTQLIENGRVERGYLGITLQALTSNLEDYYNRKGALVNEVNDGSPADAAGMKGGDLIVEIEGQEISSDVDVVRIISSYAPGTRINVKVVRAEDFTERTIQVVLGTRPTRDELQEGRPAPPDREDEEQGESVVEWKGATLSEQVVDGETVVVIVDVEPGSPAARARLGAGNQVLSINGQSVGSLAELQSVPRLDEDRALVQVETAGGRRYIVIEEDS